MTTRILLADPDIEVLDGLAKSLDRLGFAVQIASNGLACTRLLKEFLPDAWVLEPDVKDNWGWLMLAELRNRRPPTVIVSRFAESIVDNTLYEKWLVKPVSTPRLVAEIRSAIAE